MEQYPDRYAVTEALLPIVRAELEALVKGWKIDIALLPINGRDPVRGVAGNFNSEQAAALAKEIGAGLVIPCHYEMFEFNTVSPESFIRAAKELNQLYQVLKCGERLSLVTP